MLIPGVKFLKYEISQVLFYTTYVLPLSHIQFSAINAISGIFLVIAYTIQVSKV